MSDAVTIAIDGADSSRTGHARRVAISLAGAKGFSELRTGQLGIVVTEAAANIAVHAGKGELILSPWRFDGDDGIDVLALDMGQGMSDVGRSLEDGYSTAGTAGEGLGAIARLSSTLQIYSSPNRGTALWARVTRESPTAAQTADKYAMGVVNLPIAGETVCGDAWYAVHTPGRSIYMVADGLGHGPSAAAAAEEAVRVFQAAPHMSPERILADLHLALAKTRGAAISIAEVLFDRSVVNYAGVGNISGSILSEGKTRSMVSMNGTLGHTIGKIQSFAYPWDANCRLIMHSDGLATRWNFDQYPGLASRHPALMAGVLYRDFCRRRDDVTILISRI